MIPNGLGLEQAEPTTAAGSGQTGSPSGTSTHRVPL
jgi:hypothetical protein